MTRIFSILGGSALVSIALGAFFIASASAVSFHFERAPAVATKENDGTEGSMSLTAAGSTLTCNRSRFEATSSVTTPEELLFRPIANTSEAAIGYSGCTFFGVTTTVNFRTCAFRVYSNGLIDISGCSGTEPYISYKSSFLGISCEVRIGNQTGLKGATFTNVGTGATREVTLDESMESIKYDAIGSGCNPVGTGQTNGKWVTKTIATGEDDGTTTHNGFWVA